MYGYGLSRVSKNTPTEIPKVRSGVWVRPISITTRQSVGYLCWISIHIDTARPSYGFYRTLIPIIIWAVQDHELGTCTVLRMVNQQISQQASATAGRMPQSGSCDTDSTGKASNCNTGPITTKYVPSTYTSRNIWRFINKVIDISAVQEKSAAIVDKIHNIRNMFRILYFYLPFIEGLFF